MPKSWAKPFSKILKSHSEAWKKAKDGDERKTVIDTVEKAIRAQITQADGEDGVPTDIEKVSILENLQNDMNDCHLENRNMVQQQRCNEG